MNTARVVLVAGFLACSANPGSLFAQGVIATLDPPASGKAESTVEAELGDVTGDGVTDIAVTAGLKNIVSGVIVNRVYVHSGATQSNGSLPIWSVALPPYPVGGGVDPSAQSIISAGDWNGDGVPDLAVARPAANWGSNYFPPTVEVLSGLDGLSLRVISLSGNPGIGPNSFGTMTLIGQVDSDDDGLGDIAFVEYSFASLNGCLRILGPAATSDLVSIQFGFGPPGQGSFPGPACIADDVNFDGIPEVVVRTGAPVGGGNQLEIRSGNDGQLLQVVVPTLGANNGDYGSLRSLGDVNGNGFPDLAVIHSTHAQVLSLPNGNELWSAFVDQSSGPIPLDRVPDVNGDGRSDLIVGDKDFNFTFNDNRGIARLFDGSTGALISAAYTNEPQSSQFGARVLGLSDVNDDGRGDFVAEYYTSTGAFAPLSQLQVWSGGCGESTSYGSSCPGSGGSSPSLSLTGCLAGGCETKLQLIGFSGGQWPVLFLLGVQPAAIPLPFGCDLIVAPPHIVAVWPSTPPSAPGSGSLATLIDVPILPLVGQTIRIQAICADPFIARGYSVSNGLALKF